MDGFLGQGLEELRQNAIVHLAALVTAVAYLELPHRELQFNVFPKVQLVIRQAVSLGLTHPDLPLHVTAQEILQMMAVAYLGQRQPELPRTAILLVQDRHIGAAAYLVNNRVDLQITALPLLPPPMDKLQQALPLIQAAAHGQIRPPTHTLQIRLEQTKYGIVLERTHPM